MTIDKSASAIPANDKTGSRFHRTVKITGPASYATGGDLASLTQLGLSAIHVWPGVFFSNGTVVICSFFNMATLKLKFFDLTGAEIANATDLSGYSAHVCIIGR